VSICDNSERRRFKGSETGEPPHPRSDGNREFSDRSHTPKKVDRCSRVEKVIIQVRVSTLHKSG
jgi:hypothetical protein